MFNQESKTVELTRKRLGINPRKGALPLAQILTGENAGQLIPLEGEVTVGRAAGCDIQLDETGISRRHAKFLCVPGGVTLEDLSSTNGTYVSEKPITRVSLSRGETISFGGVVLAKFDYLTRGQIEIHQEIYENVTGDVLTKTLKHEAFVERLNQQRAIALRDHTHFALLLIRIDEFTNLAQNGVHDVAYVLLKQLADVLRVSTRVDDLLGRYDNETFLAYIHGTERAESVMVAERVCKNIAKHPFHLDTNENKLEFNLTASIGLAQWNPSIPLESLISAAELGLGEASSRGGNAGNTDYSAT
jgi:two-component system cell cycle response regulator